MKDLLLLALLIFSLGCDSAAARQHEEEAGAQEAPEISIQIDGAPAGKAYLIATVADQNYQIDSAQIDAGGTMTFQRETPYPSGLLYVVLPDQTYFQLLVDQDQRFALRTQAGNLAEGMQVEGSLDNELLYESLRFEAALQAKLQTVSQGLQSTAEGTSDYQKLKAYQDQLVAERKNYLEGLFEEHPNAFFTQFKKAGQNPDPRDVRLADGSIDTKTQVYLYRRALWDNVDFSDERLLRTPVIFNKLKRYITELTPQNPDSIKQSAAFLMEKVLDRPEYYKFFANWITLLYEPTKTTLMDAEAVFVFMVQNYFTYDRAFWSDSVQIHGLQLRAHEMSSSLIGQKGPDVEAKDPDGQLRSIGEITAPYVVVFLYNPSCDHCIEETPRLVEFYRQWKSKGVEVFAIALDTDVQEWQQFIARNKMDWINVFDPTNRAIYATYFVNNTPEIYVLNPDRKIIGKNLKAYQIEEVIQRDKAEGSRG